ncbi:hypothetical protein COU19_02810 [Candidatus Kaiserbacteria bacterium CG10_big_fil_rev_8_21_14_0_10_56_12]|uniref:Vitamin K epoxide reductase domain-containing protein n=1 Tax=Candidatus Kaiserbacteria bacterium CG10_big_fil_rev_8_21_14_0_10_56_12 TaxID=1974611 RepID=A0A2H0U9K4_9BACT|nr:MAG: hypothetical protein COU19_02810 [Candidatus Kaiserbacteria bacterium CG10_big_fil_rev_8_21_14_0_10_56_12]
MKRLGVIAIVVLAFFGIAVSAYLSQSETNGDPLICNVQSLSGCNTVVTSQYSHLFGISLADYGILFYTLLFVIAAFEVFLVNQLLRRLLQLFAVVGILSSAYSVYTQTYLINAICIYCMTSVLLTLLILIAAGAIEPMRRSVPPRLDTKLLP